MSQIQAATAQVATEVVIPAFLTDAIKRGMEAKRQYGNWTWEDAKPGQAWTLSLPKPLYDTADKSRLFGEVQPTFFVMEAPTPEDGDDGFSEEFWYGFLCLPASIIEPYPVLERPLERWEHAPYAWWVDMKMPHGGVIATTAEFIMPEFPIHVRREWLATCQGDFGDGSQCRVWQTAMRFFQTEKAPGTELNHYRNTVGGHTLFDVIQHIKSCW